MPKTAPPSRRAAQQPFEVFVANGRSAASAGRRTSLAVLVALALLAALLATLPSGIDAPPAEASHLRAAQLNWDQTGPNTAEFRSTFSARRSFYGSPVVGSTVSDLSIAFGDGGFEFPTYTVTFVDAVNDFFIAEATFSHTYPSAGPFTASQSTCCRLSLPMHRNNPDGNFRTETIVNFAAGTAGPVSSLSPIIDCARNAVCNFFVPATDADGRTLRWRLATPAEAGDPSFHHPGPPEAPNAATVNANTGQYSWNTTGASENPSGASFYSTQVVVEALVGGVPVSNTAVDFFIRLADQTSVNQAPQFISPTPADGAVINANLGAPVNFNVAASDPDAGDTVTLNLLGLPGGATFNTTPGNPAAGSFSWTPGATGSFILTLLAQDQFGLGATQRSVTIVVTQAPSDTTRPTCVTAPRQGGGLVLTFSDPESGISQILVSHRQNVVVQEDPFAPGDSPVTVNLSRSDPSQPAIVRIIAQNGAGLLGACSVSGRLVVPDGALPT